MNIPFCQKITHHRCRNPPNYMHALSRQRYHRNPHPCYMVKGHRHYGDDLQLICRNTFLQFIKSPCHCFCNDLNSNEKRAFYVFSTLCIPSREDLLPVCPCPQPQYHISHPRFCNTPVPSMAHWYDNVSL